MLELVNSRGREIANGEVWRGKSRDVMMMIGIFYIVCCKESLLTESLPGMVSERTHC
jgi:hypothetical protein